jgi:hypothetical protein
MKIFSPHRRKMEAKRRYGSKEFQNKIKKAQNYKRVYDPRAHGFFGYVLKFLGLESLLVRTLLVLAIGIVGYYLYFSPYFLVTQISVSGNQQVSTDQIVDSINSAGSKSWMFIPQNHLAIMSKKQTLEIVSNDLPLVKDFKKYRRVWPNKVVVEVIERYPGFVFVIDGKNYLVDEEGFVVKEIESPGDYTVVYDQVSGETVTPGERLDNTKLVAFVISATKQWPGKIKSQMREVKVPGKATQQAEFKSAEGWGVFFDINRPVEAQLSNLALILNKQIPAQSRLNLAYIDLRFDKWAYYCYKNSPCEAQPQNAAQTEEEDGTGTKVEV